MVSRISGLLGKRVLHVYDPVALQSILLKDQLYYEESSFIISMNVMVFGPGLVSTIGDQHRKQRKMLNPVFSVKHLRQMTPIFYRVAQQLQQGIKKQLKCSSGPEDVDILNWISRTALELIGQGGLGYSFDPLVEESQNTFADAIKDTIPAVWALGGFGLLAPIATKLGPSSFRRWVLDNLLPAEKIQRLKILSDTIKAEARKVIAQKRRALQVDEGAMSQQVDEGKDIMSVLLRANMKASESEKLDEDELAAQTTTLIFGATETTSGALAQILQLLAQHSDIQEQLRAEITQAGEQDIPYDQLVDLPYLDAVCRETLRLYSPVTEIYRDCIKDMVLPLSKPIQGLDGTWMKDVPVPEGTRIIISVRGCNRNKEIWGEDADEWKPERWLSPLPEAVTIARIPGVYSNLMTFAGGGRSCIGFKFSQLEMSRAFRAPPVFQILSFRQGSCVELLSCQVSDSRKGLQQAINADEDSVPQREFHTGMKSFRYCAQHRRSQSGTYDDTVPQTPVEMLR
ncbi:hypothetical protein NLI96_g8209 [Meripilus lineatus]|uniref:Cytochrome P450 n=1 Tax=Meripilus lineatus TaxID=2056292 RepID=A0AAD5UXY5_9APHY|nr:hypothetical protein NLI96_g8209 [Physisporinus lineatus]